jgi:hypothetical protein
MLEHLHIVTLEVCSKETDFGMSWDEAKRDFWSGECASCQTQMFDGNDEFKQEWIRKKEFDYPRPPTLKRVCWKVVQTGVGADLDEFHSEYWDDESDEDEDDEHNSNPEGENDGRENA